MTRNARTQEKRSSLCHVGEGAAAQGTRQREGGRRVSRTRANADEPASPHRDNFYARGRSNAERREAGARFESHALAFLQRQRLVLVARNVHCRGGELDLVMRDRDGTLVFVEVRARTRHGYGGAAASVGWHKQQRIVRAARYYLAGLAMNAHAREALPTACRFDVVTFDGGRLAWLRDAFREDGR
ncbi:YraN family protein [Paraburkholderia sacchari]|uniref:YraN family protein n=1 Tax=Paraburkholderia sacchari TaxID=159450 RepID=UPI001BD0BE45|nr:YraN family protein [Paraburkholderia sacchari]